MLKLGIALVLGAAGYGIMCGLYEARQDLKELAAALWEWKSQAKWFQILLLPIGLFSLIFTSLMKEFATWLWEKNETFMDRCFRE